MDVDEQPGEGAVEEKTDEERAVEFKALGNKEYSAKRFTAAIDLYSEAIGLSPRPEFYGNRAAAYIALARYQDGLNDCLAALEVDESYRKAYIRGVKCYTELAQFEKAKQLAQTGLNQFPTDQEIKRGNDRVHILQNKLRRIDEKLSAVSAKYNSMFESSLSPNNATSPSTGSAADSDDKEEKTETPSAPLKHKLSSKDAQEVDIALSMIESLLRNDMSQSVPLKCTQIRALIIKQNYDAALSKATNVLRFNKNDNEVTRMRAIALFRNGSTDSAIKHLQQILRKDPDNKSVKLLYKVFKNVGRAKEAGNAAFKAQKLDEAIEKYSQCLQLDPTNLAFNCIIYANRAAVWLKKKEWQKAYDDCSQALDFDSAYVKAYNRRIQSLYRLNRFDEAVGDAENALKLDPGNGELRQQLREAKVELKKSKQKNYYKILGVERDATETEIKKGFRKKAMKWHPDKFASKEDSEKKQAEETFKEIGEAYEVLKDPKLKQRYDSGVDPENLKSGGGFPGGGFGGGVDISHIFDLLGNQGGGGHPFHQHFGGGGGHGHGHGGGGGGYSFRFQ